MKRSVLFDRRFFRRSIERSSRRENQALDAVREHGFKQGQCIGGVVAKKSLRMLHGFAGFNECGEVHNRLRLVLGENAIERGAVGDIANDQFRPGGQRGAVPVRKIVKDDRLIAALEQLRYHHASNVASAARYEYSLRHAFVGLSDFAAKFALERARTSLPRASL